jgi:FkbM family methyltransferase
MFGCREPHNREYEPLYECMHARFASQIYALRAPSALNDTRLVEQRMAEAGAAPTNGQPRYTFVPAAVGSKDGWFDVPWSSGGIWWPRTVLRSGSPPGGMPSGYRVRMVDLVSWMRAHFRSEDLVFMKMDVEGAEHNIFRRLLSDGGPTLVDLLALECHGSGWSCTALSQKLEARNTTMVQERLYYGVDSYSSPSRLKPVDPRSGSV